MNLNLGTHSWITIAVVGLVAGWLAGLVTKGRGFGFILNIVVGVLGAFLGTYLFAHFGILATGFIGLLIAAVVGAVVLVAIVSIIQKIAR